MVDFKKENINPRNRKTADCVIRAIAMATGDPYELVRDELFEIMKKTGYMMNTKQVYEKYLDAKGWEKQKQPRREDGTKYRVGEIDELIGKYDTAVIGMPGHLSVVKNGTLIDNWDSRRKIIGNYYIRRAQL